MWARHPAAMNRRSTLLFLLLVLVAAGAAMLSLRNAWFDIPPRWNPWAPLDVDEVPNLLTKYKLARAGAQGAQCRAVLATTPLQFQAIADEETGPSCGFQDAVRVERTQSFVGAPFALSCRAALSVALWERHGVQPAALRHFGQAVTRIDHFGSYACRNVYGRPEATRSRHATAEAWDVAGFVLADGKQIRVAQHWHGLTAEAAFLRDVRDAACRFFDGVLSPDYNAAHHDHLHLDRGPYRMCR